MAPSTDMKKPAPWPAWYQPMACPRYVARTDPTIPRIMVIKIPPGSLPGILCFVNYATSDPSSADSVWRAVTAVTAVHLYEFGRKK